MRKWTVLLSILLLLDVAAHFAPVRAQGSSVPYWFSVGSALHTSCTVTANVTSYCWADDGAWVSIHGAAWAPVGGGSGVTSVFGRTGDVKATAGDYTFAQIASPPTFVNSFAGRTGIVVPASGDYTYPLISGTPPIKSSFSCTQLSLNTSATPPYAANGCQ